MIELAWAAGFFDGEGCTSVHQPRKAIHRWSTLKVSLKQNDRRALDRFHAAVRGLGSVNGPYEYVGRNPFYVYEVYGDDADTVLMYLWPYLGDAKKEQADRVMDQLANTLVA